MSLSLGSGTRLGPYEILSAIGAGGMGEVYRAKDTRLNRDVAIKVLPQVFVNDAERLARFTREAQTLAALNHPNIAAIYGVDESGGVPALVMEFVGGKDLSAHIARGPMPLSDALPIARQIADALEAAHEAGIVHRDLKPANIKVRADGTVKVLDFGLAKAVDPAGAASAAAMQSPTLTAHATQMGIIVGTAAYMAPEQARGRAVDKRADVWAFGVVVYEMLTGARAFKGEAISDVLAAVLRQDIDWNALPSDTPLRLRRVLERCLDRDPRTRLRDVGEARVEIAKVESGALDTSATAAPSSRRWREAMAYGVAGAAVLIVIAIGYIRQPAAPPARGPVVRLPFVASDSVVAEIGNAIISPDGRKLVISGRSSDGRRMLWVRSLDSMEATMLPDTDDAIEPFWSPDSRSIAFGAQGKLKRIDLGATRAQPLADAARSNNGAWSPSGVIVFSPDYRSPLFRVPAGGGERSRVTTIDTAHGDTGHRFPVFLPDGRHFLYSSNRPGAWAVMAGSVDSTDTKMVLPEFGPAVYAPPGWLLYVRNGSIVAQAFDASRLQLSGEPQRITAAPSATNWAQGGRISVSETGVLVVQNPQAYNYQLAWFDRTGTQLGTFGPVRRVTVAEFPRVSPDGKRVLVQRTDLQTQNQDLWIGDLARGTYDRFTTDPTMDQLAFWSLDGKGVYCATTQNGVGGIFRLPVDGGEGQLVVTGTAYPGDVSPDGRWLFYFQSGETTRLDVWALPLSGGQRGTGAQPHPIIHSEFDERQAQVSPDTRWIAYMSDITGTSEVYVRRLLAEGRVSEATRVSTGGGAQPRWSRDGKELFFVSAPQGYYSAQMMTVPVKSGGEAFEFGPSTPLFKVHMLPLQSVVRDYDLSLDGQRFLIGTTVGDVRSAPATLVLDWMAELKK